jgi:hypothetical protein
LKETAQCLKIKNIMGYKRLLFTANLQIPSPHFRRTNDNTKTATRHKTLNCKHCIRTLLRAAILCFEGPCKLGSSIYNKEDVG